MDLVQDLKSRVSITDVVARYRPLHKAGKNFKALCPFHDDHSPSMIVNPSQNFAWCFACQNGGDIFAFVQKIEGVDFPESVQIIGEIAGIDTHEFSEKFHGNSSPEKIEENKIKSKQKKEHSVRIREVLEETNQFFLASFEKSPEAQKYVFEARKFLKSTQQKFCIGYAPDSFEALEKHLLSRKFSRKEMLDAGVVKQSDKNPEKVYDRFRQRVMFPFYDSSGKICGFGGRILGEGAPKYLNSPETALYDKSKNLFGFAKAKEMIRKKNMAVLVEGNFDVMTCHEQGITPVVAVSGVGFSVEQARLLKRFCTRVTLALDSDEAGMKASERILEVLLQEKFSVRIMEISGESKDPDEAIRKDKQRFVEDLVGAEDAISVILSRLVAKNDISKSEGKRAVFASVFPLISKIPENLEKNEALVAVSKALQTNLTLIEESFSGFAKSQKSYTPDAFSVKNSGETVGKKTGRFNNDEEISLLEFFFGVLVSYFSESEKIFEVIDTKFFIKNAEKNLYEELLSAYNSRRDFSAQGFCAQQERELQEKLQKACLFVDDKLCNLPKDQRKTEISRIAISVGTHLLGEQIKTCSEKIKKNLSPEVIEDLQFFSLALKKFHI